jgi:hypothetical protein
MEPLAGFVDLDVLAAVWVFSAVGGYHCQLEAAPRRTSMATDSTGTVIPGPPQNAARCSGSVKACHTRSLGASTTKPGSG